MPLFLISETNQTGSKQAPNSDIMGEILRAWNWSQAKTTVEDTHQTLALGFPLYNKHGAGPSWILLWSKLLIEITMLTWLLMATCIHLASLMFASHHPHHVREPSYFKPSSPFGLHVPKEDYQSQTFTVMLGPLWVQFLSTLLNGLSLRISYTTGLSGRVSMEKHQNRQEWFTSNSECPEKDEDSRFAGASTQMFPSYMSESHSSTR